MSSVMKMSIQGIRSFGPEDKDKGVIELFSPLTLILGPNGTGKTTIIECLKYMTTGEMPPGAKTGGAFIHDPKIAHEREVKAQIRLQFRDVKGEICVAQRSLVATQQAKNVTMKTLDGVITRKMKDGTKASISKRCADMDREIVALLGVSKPVLENVIFCHQEDANWPLSEGKALKQKFDDIFASTRYVKALETIRKLRQEHSSTVKMFATEMKYLKQNKEKAAEIKRDLGDRETRYLASRENVEKINEKLEPIKEKLLLIQKKSNDIYKLNTNIEKLKSQRAQMVRHTEELREHIINPFKGSTEALIQTLEKFEAQVREKEDTLSKLESSVLSLDRKIEKVSSKKSDLLLTQGKLEQEAERHKENIKKRDARMRKIAEKLEIAGFSSALDDGKVDELLRALDNMAAKSLKEAKETRSDYEETESRFQREVEKLRNKKTTLETQQKMKTDQMKKNTDEVRSINQELSRVAASGEKLKDIELDLKRAESKLLDAENSVDLDKLKSEITKLQQEKGKFDVNLKHLDTEMSRISRESSVRSELDLFRKDKTSKEDQVRRLKSRNEDSVKHLLGSFPEENLSRRLDTYITQQSREVRHSQAKLQQLSSEMARLEADRRNCQEQLRRKEGDLRDYEKKIGEVCHSQSLQESLEKVEGDLKAEQDRRGGLTGMTYLYNRYLENLVKKSECPLCETQFGDEAVERLRTQLDKKLSLVPEKIEKCDRKLKETKAKHEKIIELRPVKAAAKVLEEGEIPILKSTLKKTSQLIDKTTLDISEQEDTMETKQVDESTAKSMQSDVTMIDAHLREIKELTRKIETHASKLSGGDSQRTMQEVQNEREELILELENTNRGLDRRRDKQSEQNEYIQRAKGEMNELKAEKLQIESDLQQRVRLEEQKEQLENLNAVLITEIDDAKEEVEPLKTKLEQVEREREEVVRQKEEEWEKDKETVSQYRSNQSDLQSRQNEVHRYLQAGKDKQLEQSHQQMVKIEEMAESIVEEKQELAQQCTTLNKELQKQKSHQRELEDNLNLRKKEEEIETVVEKIKQAKVQLGDLDVENLEKERQTLQERQGNMIKEKHQLEGRKQGLEDEIRKFKKELKDDMFKDADEKHREKIIALRTTELASQDLDKYYRALDRAIMSYHSNKMADINKIIRELWRNTYKGNDIETIEIRSDQDDKTSAGCDKRRSYNYRVVMIKGDAAIDMRGRCSAGQKVLASIIIRLALAETFCLNCGILALDEPTTNLDRENIESLAYALDGIIKARSKQTNFQLLVITHDEDFVELLGRSDYVEEFFKVRKDQFACSQLVKAKVQDLHTR